MITFLPVEQPTMGLDATKAASREAFRLMSNAATKAAALCSYQARLATDPDTATSWEQRAECWQKSASIAFNHMRELG